MLAPLGVLLPNGLGLNVDGKDIGRAYFVRLLLPMAAMPRSCSRTSCSRPSAPAPAPTFIVFQTPEEGIGIPVDLKGFAEGYDALP